MARAAGVVTSVLIRRVVAATHLPARRAHAQMHPRVARLEAVDTPAVRQRIGSDRRQLGTELLTSKESHD